MTWTRHTSSGGLLAVFYLLFAGRLPERFGQNPDAAFHVRDARDARAAGEGWTARSRRFPGSLDPSPEILKMGLDRLPG